ncbi:MAG: anti-sigma factor [Cyclobacteriaceae bacterium]
MNKEEIISQGYLESYLTGELSHENQQEVEALLTQDEEVRLEYYKIEKLLESLAFHYGVNPSPAVKRMVMENPSVMLEMNPSTEKSSSGKKWKLMVAASGLIAMLSALSAFYFWTQWKTTDQELSMLVAQNLELAQNFNKVNSDFTNLQQDIAVLISPDYRRVILAGTENSPNASAVIYWNKTNKKVLFNTGSMQSLPANKQYQLWALVDGKPINAGIFDTYKGRFQIMKNIEQADAFAVTIEPNGGSVNPTLETLQVIGNT